MNRWRYRRGLDLVIGALLSAALWMPVNSFASWHEGAPAFQGQMRDFALRKVLKPVPDYEFAGPDGEKIWLSGFQNKVVLLNFWATWCPPCVEEMPSLDGLQAKFGDDGFEVVALSLDRDRDIVERFFADYALENLAIYMDSKGKAVGAFRIGGLPTSIVIGSKGNIVGTLVGPADWSSPDAHALVAYLMEKSSAVTR